MVGKCVDPAASRRRIFWTTQPSACGTYEYCDDDCGVPGLQLLYGDNCVPARCSCECPGLEIDLNCLAHNRAARVRAGATIANNDWVRGLLLNIFNTYARLPNTECGIRPGAQGGHWSESYREDGLTTGTGMYNVPTNSSINNSIKLINAAVSKDAQKLVQLGVATGVQVDTVYLGNNKVSVTIEVFGPGIVSGVVNLFGSMIENAWVWS